MSSCSICGHPDRTHIDMRIAAGDNLTLIANFYEFSLNVLERHSTHIRDVAVRVQTEPTGLLLDLERAEQQAWALLKFADGLMKEDGSYAMKPDPYLKLRALAEIRAYKMDTLKAAKELAIFKAGVVPAEKFRELAAIVMKALEPWPEALRAVKEAIEEMG